MRPKVVVWVLSFAVLAVFSSAAVAGAGSGQNGTPAEQKVERPVDESDSRVIAARGLQQLEDDLGALVQNKPDAYSGVIAVSPGSYQVLVKEGTDKAEAANEVAALVREAGRPSDSVSVATVPHSQAELTALHSQVDALLDEMQSAGADVVGTGPNLKLGKVQIDIESGQEAAERVLGALARDVYFVTTVTSKSQSHGSLTVGR